ncbi:hypothetical protein CC1G_09049 [Coprinopsis cinerea okayama7|uniref:Uncharacterized protein n=1 Tax=Coprinopsis cinerea (strain Okayama-7 / 130 / ATCC MYA-4618 / FGSC 9003) TaxID=240176 RepID=A8P2Y0_COPC7|nr:hypothetical protein CC1G_09049 [Coprinopsis cinerea okayama7\|eukprot:XP_001838421.1 hypothetical protein CC1G_09049 [Coprinopsis cinerea okayama7\
MEDFVETYSAAKIGRVAAERMREMATAVVEKREKGCQSKLVASILTAVPQYQFVLVMEVGKDNKLGKYVCLQHVASIQDRVNGALTQSAIEAGVMASLGGAFEQRGQRLDL